MREWNTGTLVVSNAIGIGIMIHDIYSITHRIFSPPEQLRMDSCIATKMEMAALLPLLQLE
jgi:hypothetical protein